MAEPADNTMTTTAADRRRAEIIALSATLFDQHGYSSVSMEQIALAAGLAKPSLYHYFRGKDEILSGIHETFIDILLERQDQRRQLDLPADVVLLGAMTDIFGLMETHRGHVRVFFNHHRELPEEAQATMRAKRDAYELMVENLYVEGMAAGTFRKADPKLASLATFGMCNWAYQWFRPGGPMRTREIAYQFWGFLVHGLENTDTRPVRAEFSAAKARAN